MAIPAILGGISLASNLAGLIGGVQSNNEQNAAAKKAAKEQYEQALEIYNYDWDSTLRKHEYAKATVDLQRYQSDVVHNFKTALATQSWEHQMHMREYEHINRVAAFNRSEQMFEDQMGLNILSAKIAQDDAGRAFDEAQLAGNFAREGLALDLHAAMDTSAFAKAAYSLERSHAIGTASNKRRLNELQFQQKSIDNAFKAQGNAVEAILAEGRQRARGASGRSAGKAIQSILMAAGTQQASIRESMSSAKTEFKIQANAIDQSMINAINTADLMIAKEDNSIDRKRQQYNLGLREIDASIKSAAANYRSNLMKIDRDKQAADMRAHYNRMLEPTMSPEIPRPLALPRSIFLDPLPPIKPPEPRKSAPQTISSWNSFAQAMAGVGNIANNLNTMGQSLGWFDR